ncbi:MAG: 3-deoxy-7-phosphoheptulonate synthase [Pseudomonadota bacterium]
MQYQTDDLRITGMQESIAPEDLMTQIPLDAEISSLVFRTRREVADVIHKRDDRLLAVVGPCSIHDPQAALDYAKRLAEQAQQFQDNLLVVMRVYFEKPRTIVGWKGLINDPHLNNTYDINHGLATARRLLLNINQLGITAGTEYLDPITPQYVGDLVTWGAIGARTTESQIHRQLTSGLSCPVGFKNSTDGTIQIAADAIRSSAHSHVFLSVTKQGHSAIFSTSGNPDCHIILRGGNKGTNYDAESIASTRENLDQGNITTGIMVDMSHANSEKQHKKQLDVCASLAQQIAAGNRDIVGVMVESNLEEGRQDIPQDLSELAYGQSVTDACIHWDDTKQVLTELNEAVASRRSQPKNK